MNHELHFGLPANAINKLRDVFNGWPEIQRVVLYGSRAKGSYRPGSDIDLTIEADALSLSQLLALENQIDELLLPWMVDLSLKRHIDNPALLDHIHRVGVPFYVRQDKALPDIPTSS